MSVQGGWGALITREQWYAELRIRRRAVWEIAGAQNCDLVLVCGSQGHAEPFRYLTNFAPVLGDMWALLAGPDQVQCILNFSWQLIEAWEFSGIASWQGHFDLLPSLLDAMAAHQPKRVGVVGLHRVPALVFDAMRARFPGAQFVDIGGKVAELRRIKSPLELTLLREAARLTDIALDAARSELRPGLTETELAARVGSVVQSLGGEWAFPPCVVSGVAHPVPIRMPTSRPIALGDSVMVDFGAAVGGYQADATRTFVVGQPSREQLRVWDTVRRAYEAALSLARPGVPCRELNRAGNAVIEDAGYPVAHRIGHGIGLATSFEWPDLTSETALLAPGMTICIEPGIYVAGAGNMKLEDDLVITKDGCELLTHCSCDLVVSV